MWEDPIETSPTLLSGCNRHISSAAVLYDFGLVWKRSGVKFGRGS